MIRYPAPLRRGDTIAVTSPSAGVEGSAAARIDFCVQWLRSEGFEVVVGDCMDGSGITSASAERRAAELTAMLCDPAVRCVLPPWGGETAVDLVDLPGVVVVVGNDFGDLRAGRSSVTAKQEGAACAP